ncbi:FtsW/RodA/SpoVE family cell cycle protein [Coprobacter tertius]|uniref:Probable peptidoglycan glycosyltransferase FtsW n=1 Tax=Coprobacter tertius TaxID=2944915 RepID=A0ABT1MHN5_9BACT|nr:FtsW/RodA/SpoVE family cell cycle protein [Coprobacter tertius]MCP9610746.1 FtsW/RodA/SpoVE family cell cycle protein [Coprobacter tertius]
MEGIRSIPKGDKYIWGIYFVLCIISIVEMYSASSTLTFKIQDYFAPTIRHALFLFCGTMGVLVMQNIHYKWFKGIGLLLLVVAFFLLIYALAFGKELNDTQRWISLGGISLQPSEFAKLGMVIFTAFILANKQTSNGVEKNTFTIIFCVLGVFFMLIFPENFSTAVLLAAVVYCMMLIGRIELKKWFGSIAIIVLVGLSGLFISKYLPEDVGIFKRMQTWENRLINFNSGDIPEYEIKTGDKNYQVHHARMAIANGGVFGKFIGNSRERDFLPQAYSDFIYAIIIEETGLVGGIVVMLLYLSLLIRAGMIAKKCTRAFPAFLILGIALMIVFQAMINMSVAVGLIPVTGQPLPLISRGGTSTIVTCFYFGIMLSISRYATLEGMEEEKKLTGSVTEVPEDLAAPNPNM